MSTVISKEGHPYETYRCLVEHQGELTVRYFGRLDRRHVVETYLAPASSKGRENIRYAVTRSVVFGDAPEDVAWDCGCESYWFNYEREGPVAFCKHITEFQAHAEAERKRRMDDYLSPPQKVEIKQPISDFGVTMYALPAGLGILCEVCQLREASMAVLVSGEGASTTSSMCHGCAAIYNEQPI